jgi:hypothetical protein
MSAHGVLLAGGGPGPATASADLRPAGERYLRHPGDGIRLVLWVRPS